MRLQDKSTCAFTGNPTLLTQNISICHFTNTGLVNRTKMLAKRNIFQATSQINRSDNNRFNITGLEQAIRQFNATVDRVFF